MALRLLSRHPCTRISYCLFALALCLASGSPGQTLSARDLTEKAAKLLAQAMPEDAADAAEQAVRLLEESKETDDESLAAASVVAARAYEQLGQSSKAGQFYRRALAAAGKAFGEEHAKVADILVDLGRLLRNTARFEESIQVYSRAVAIREKLLGPRHPDVATALNGLASVYSMGGEFQQAWSLAERALNIREAVLGKDHPSVADSLNTLLILSQQLAKYEDAEQYARRLEDMVAQESVDKSLLPAVLINIGNLYLRIEKFADAEKYFKQALDALEGSADPNSIRRSMSVLVNLAFLYSTTARYSESERFARRALAAAEKYGASDVVVAALDAAAGACRAQGRVIESETLYRRAISVDENAGGPNSLALSHRLNNLGDLLATEGRYEEAEQLALRALAIRENALGPDHPEVAITADNLGEIYMLQARYPDAERLIRRALDIKEKTFGPVHSQVGVSLGQLAAVYQSEGKSAEARALMERGLEIARTTLGPQHPETAEHMSRLAALYTTQGDFVQAGRLYRQAIEVLEKSVGPGNPLTAISREGLATVYYAQKQPKQAAQFFNTSLAAKQSYFDRHFLYLTEKERLGFADTLSDSISVYSSFCLTYWRQHPELAGQMYDLLLWKKALVAKSVSALREQVAAGSDQRSLELLDRLAGLRTQIANLLIAQRSNLERLRAEIDDLERTAEETERRLVERSQVFAENRPRTHVTWRDVKSALQKGEAAVEFTRFRYHDGREWTDKDYYVALVVTSGTSQSPRLVMLGDAEDIEHRSLQAYRDQVSARTSDPLTAGKSADFTAPYSAYWKPLIPALKGIRRVYVSPDGMLNQISFAVIRTPEGEYLGRQYDLRLVSNTGDLLRKAAARGNKAMAILVGNPRFALSEDEQRARVRSMGRAQSNINEAAELRSLRGAVLDPLPATAGEISQIRDLLEHAKWDAQVYTADHALEEAVKNAKRPRLMHLATHGFFLPDPADDAAAGAPHGRRALIQDPMLRSGLYLAGADRTLAGSSPVSGLDDGVLTALEAANLDLRDTEIVVLSSCETGLGRIKTGEGVFGLRRAFQIAGARSVLMSLWAVPDTETKELMTLFYKHWLAGADKHDALRRAQAEMREVVRTRYGADLAFYWGAFVLAGF